MLLGCVGWFRFADCFGLGCFGVAVFGLVGLVSGLGVWFGGAGRDSLVLVVVYCGLFVLCDLWSCFTGFWVCGGAFPVVLGFYLYADFGFVVVGNWCCLVWVWVSGLSWIWLVLRVLSGFVGVFGLCFGLLCCGGYVWR